MYRRKCPDVSCLCERRKFEYVQSVSDRGVLWCLLGKMYARAHTNVFNLRSDSEYSHEVATVKLYRFV